MTLSPSFAKNPDLDSWLQIHADGRVTVFTGKVELGQKLKTAFAVIAAEELDVDPGRITVRTAETGAVGTTLTRTASPGNTPRARCEMLTSNGCAETIIGRAPAHAVANNVGLR